MIMPNEFSPPIPDLPEEIYIAIDKFTEGVFTAYDLRHTIRTALADQDAALRERCERLRRDFLNILDGKQAGYYVRNSDLADDLRPRGDVLP